VYITGKRTGYLLWSQFLSIKNTFLHNVILHCKDGQEHGWSGGSVSLHVSGSKTMIIPLGESYPHVNLPLLNLMVSVTKDKQTINSS
jgi:hypothetical protein